MSKTKKQILIFIIIILFGVGYAFNQYVIIPSNLLNEKKLIEMRANKQKLSLLKSKSLDIVKEKAAVLKLKLQASELSNLTVHAVNTPQLVYDFYTSCKEYNIKGEDLTFQLVNNTETTQIAPNKNSTTNNAITPTPTTDATKKTGQTSDLIKLTIDLKVSGYKNQVQQYIKNLSTFTNRKINVKSINLAASLSQKADTGNSGLTSQTLVIPQANMQQGSIKSSTPIVQATDQVTADIIFYQYIYNEGNQIESTNNYDFYNSKPGLNDFSEMFK